MNQSCNLPITLFCLFFLSLSSSAQTDITIDPFALMNQNVQFVGGVYTATGSPAIITDEDLVTNLNAGDVTILSDGEVDFLPLCEVTVTSESTLNIDAQGNISVNQNMNGGSALNYVLRSLGEVTLSPLDLNTNGGDFTVIGSSFSNSSFQLNTQGGNIDIEVSDGITIRGAGISTVAGNINFLAGGTIDVCDNGINTGGGDVDFEARADMIISCGGLVTNGGNVNLLSVGPITINNNALIAGDAEEISIVATAGAITISGGGINTTGPMTSIFINATINHNVSISQSGIVGNGEITIIGNDVNITDGGIQWRDSGLTTQIFAGGTIITSQNGIVAGDATVSLCAAGQITIGDGGISTLDGQIDVNSEVGIDVTGIMGSGNGSGGTLNQTGSNITINDLNDIGLGAADINLNTIYTFRDPALPIPSMGQWGVIILSLILMIVGRLSIMKKVQWKHV